MMLYRVENRIFLSLCCYLKEINSFIDYDDFQKSDIVYFQYL